MPFLLLLLLSIPLIGDKWPAPEWGWRDDPSSFHLLFLVVVNWSGVALMAALAWALAWRTRREALRHPERRETILHRYASRRLYHLFGQIGFYGLALYSLGWGWTVQQVFGQGDGMMPGAELLILAPFFTTLVLSWACFYDADKALHDTAPGPWSAFWSRRASLAFHIRQNLAMMIAPLVLMIGGKALQRVLPEGVNDVISIVLLLGVFIGLPWILRLVLSLEPLPPGPLRARLVRTAQRLKLRYSNILLWNTHGGVANAMVAGLLPFPRYVLLSDRLVSDLSPDEVEAVFGHEVGHIKHAHMIYYVGFLLLSLPAVFWAFELATGPNLRALVSENELWVKPPVVALVGAYVFVVFGFLSRRCERQADIFGCRAVSCSRRDCVDHTKGEALAPEGRGLCPTGIRTFIDALEKVADANGMSRSKPGWLQSWQHSTIARRVAFLQQVLKDPTIEPRFQRTVGRVKWGLFLGLLGVLLVLACIQWGDKLIGY